MNFEVKDLPAKITPLLLSLKKYLVFIFIISVLVIYVALVLFVNTLASQQPNDDAVNERLNTVTRPRINEDTLDKIQQLEDQNIQVQTLFQDARDNPFNE